ncbi:beta-defensin 30 precursor [Mus musculus]|uniref:Beta-defensin 30 n=2 Tax=Mus TaxID=862507 RepID=DFB30_MOUSE|nr:beta-defensin 30 precursor [Mus musculus]NP_001399512.1 beta-defensin 30 precursor [Mus musculus]Q30KN4.1 RecName: Full=Beta-defensin 30; Short=BD-30; Short=mBD-30; AltName: Full=Defensin, beta 30; Flags: Precursor [Mus musculus]AAI32185.1 Defensin beta 30 [Mus musculus]AAI32215.1 Defensin beta 30 [Mus musculus]AAY59776.1 beta-defensin 30 [Mus musculus]ABA26845.1 DEFB30 precursor [Mus musculus]|eukprot:NP_001034655.1 beta-defensin 30 precursor [Mus musculus]
MGSLQLTLVLFVLLSYVPPVRSGVNMYIKRIYDTCWKLKGICRNTCQKEEIYHIFCGIQSLCCLEKKEMPVLFVK